MNETTSAWRLPAMVNGHSHAFQRAMAGLAERLDHPSDSFWTWRELMYRFAGLIGPEDLYAIATQLYVELLKSGYGTVCEFHYLHHQPDGTPYAAHGAMSQALIAAAEATGIRLVLLPTLYMTRGFDGGPLSDRQKRFGHTVEQFQDLLANLSSLQNERFRLGMALHSLRAVPPGPMQSVLASEWVQSGPIHIHIAEQTAEVDECLALRGARPVNWLLDHAEVDSRWTLVHATHVRAGEIERLSATGANVCICASTEANLGDGIFPLREFLQAGGAFSIGTDSHVSVSVVEELRWLEYGQRLERRVRNVAATEEQPQVGANLYARALAGGRLAAGQSTPVEDHIVLDQDAVEFAGARPEQIADVFVFAGNRNLIKQVVVAGETVIDQGRHAHEVAIADRYRATMARLLRA